MNKEMRNELKVANGNIRKAKADLKVYASAIAKLQNDIMSENSPFPAFRDKVLEMTLPFAQQYVCGQITKREMNKKYDEFYTKLLRMFIAMLWQYPNAEPMREALCKLTYHSIRRDAIRNGETVCPSAI